VPFACYDESSPRKVIFFLLFLSISLFVPDSHHDHLTPHDLFDDDLLQHCSSYVLKMEEFRKTQDNREFL